MIAYVPYRGDVVYYTAWGTRRILEMFMALPIKINLPSGFLSEEFRCGYLVSEKRKRVWAVELDLVSEFSRVCEEHGIRWSIIVY